MNTTSEKNAYGEKEQKKLVAILITDEKNFKDIIEIIEPESFDNPCLQLIVKIFINFYKKHECKPDDEELGNEIKKAVEKDKRLPIEEISEVLDDVFNIVDQPESLNYVRDEYIQFAKKQKLKKTIIDGARLYKRGESADDASDKLIKQLEETKTIGKKDSAEELVVVNLADVETTEVEWLWHRRIPVGKLSLLVGDPGGGKSFLSLFMISKITGGGVWPDLIDVEVKRGSVILLTAEDDLADTVRPRVDAMDGDAKKVTVIKCAKEAGKLRSFSLVEDVVRLENLIKEKRNVRAVIIDPMSAYMGSLGKAKVDSYRDADVRSVLEPFARLAEQYKLSIIGIMHLNKSTVKAIYRVLGSIGFVGSARATWLVVKDKDWKVTDLRFLVALKLNLTSDPGTLAFRITDDKRVVFTGETYDVDIEEQLSGKDRSAFEKAIEFLTKQFECAEGDVISAKDMEEAAEEEGIKEGTLRKAKEKMGVRSEKRKEGWVWLLPEKTEK